MLYYVDNLIGGWIKNAEKTGELDNNPYKGKKLDMDEYFETPAEHRMSMKILKDANVLPPAVQLMQQIEKKKLEQTNVADPALKEELRKEIMRLELNRDLQLKRQ